MKFTSIAVALILCSVARGADAPNEGSPAWIVETFFTRTTFPTPERYYSGEMRHHLASPPMGAYVPPGYDHAIGVLSESADTCVYRFTYLSGPKAGDWYAFLMREDGAWKLSAVRTLAIPNFVRQIRDRLRAQSQRSEQEEAELQKLDLIFASDAELKTFLNGRIASFQTLASRVIRGATNDEVRSEADKLRINHVSVTEEGFVHLVIGGVLDNSVGYLFVPAGKVRPRMNQENFILVDPVCDGWFLVKTT